MGSFWTGTVPFRESTPATSAGNNAFAFPSSVPSFEPSFKPTSSPRRHRQTYSGGSHHTHNGSGSTTVPGDFGYNANVNIGHLQLVLQANLQVDSCLAARVTSVRSPFQTQRTITTSSTFPSSSPHSHLRPRNSTDGSSIPPNNGVGQGWLCSSTISFPHYNHDAMIHDASLHMEDLVLQYD